MRVSKYLAAAGTVAAAAALAVAAPIAAASAATAAAPAAVLTVNGLGGAPVLPTDLLTSPLTPGTLLSLTSVPGGGTGLFCQTSVWQAEDMSNPAVPGTAVLQLLPPLTISGCKDSNPGVINVVSVSVANLPALLQVTGASPYPIQILPMSAPLQIIVNLDAPGPVTCVYTQATGAITGSTALGANPWLFAGQPFTTSPSAACGPATNFFSASYSQVTDSSMGGSPVFVN
jgi:hypothetical protein